VNFLGNNEYNDGFSYDNWGGYNLLAKFNLRNSAVVNYHLETVRYWVSEFDIDGLRLDTADVLDFDFMRALRDLANTVKPEFWLMGEVIHGEYQRWVNPGMLHAVTDYALHKALYSGHNDHNYFEIAHTIRYTGNMISSNIRLYNFVDNHDVERIYTKLTNKAHYFPVHVLLYTLPGIPSVYYGSEFGIEGRKERWSDDSLRPYIDLKEHAKDYTDNPCTKLVLALGKVRREYTEDLSYGDYRELLLTNRQFAYGRGKLRIAVNNDENPADVSLPAEDGEYIGLLSGEKVTASGGRLNVRLNASQGEIYAPAEGSVKGLAAKVSAKDFTPAKPEAKSEPKPEKKPEKQPVKQARKKKEPAHETAKEAVKKEVPEAEEKKTDLCKAEIPDIPYSEMTVEQLQAVILAKMAKNGPVSDQMRKDVEDNIWHNSLVNWANSFRN
jgi:hypothetical protein